MLGAGTPAQELPYFYSDQYDVAMEYLGHAAGADRRDLPGRPSRV